MGNQSIFYSYFQSWEWKETWKDNDLRRIAGDHYSLIKNGLITSILTITGIGILLYFLYNYHLLNWYDFSEIVWFNSEQLYSSITQAQVLNVYWYLLLGYGLLFWGMIIYFLVYPKYPSYTFENTPLILDIDIQYLRFVSVRNTYILGIFIGLVIFYTVFNTPALIASDMASTTKRGVALYIVPFFTFSVIIYRSALYWWHGVINSVLFLYVIWFFTVALGTGVKQYSLIVVSILKTVIPSAIIGSIVIVVACLLTVVISMLRARPNENSIYKELSKKMKPWLGFNERFVSESFINEEFYDFKELYELTHPKKKGLFWLEYFFSNILNKNVVSLLQSKKLLWLRVLFNWADALNSKSMVTMDWSEESSKKRKTIIETMPTREKAKFEDPEGDVFTNLLIEEVPNTKPSIILPFYVSGLIYLNVIPYFLIYNVVMLVIFTKFVDIITPMNIELINILLYGYVGGMALIFMGFLLAIFMNSMGVWLAWKKYYRLQNEGNTDAIFFSIFKQRVIYQYINEYAKDEEGNTITNNYERGLYPQFDLEKLDKIAEELSPKYYGLFSKKYPLYTKADIQTYLK